MGNPLTMPPRRRGHVGVRQSRCGWAVDIWEDLPDGTEALRGTHYMLKRPTERERRFLVLLRLGTEAEYRK